MTWRTATFGVWAVLAAVAVAAQVVAVASRGRRVGAAGGAVTFAVSRRWARVLILLGWAWLGWHAFAR